MAQSEIEAVVEQVPDEFAVTLAEEDLVFVSPTQQSGAVRTKELMELMSEEGFTMGFLVPDTNTMQFKRD